MFNEVVETSNTRTGTLARKKIATKSSRNISGIWLVEMFN